MSPTARQVRAELDAWLEEEQRQRRMLTRAMWEAFWKALDDGTIPPRVFVAGPTP